MKVTLDGKRVRVRVRVKTKLKENNLATQTLKVLELQGCISQ